MIKKPNKSSCNFFVVISILIAFSLLFSCSSNRVADVTERSGQSAYKGRIHRVANGETLFSIAWRYGIDHKILAEFNSIRPPYTIFPAQQIQLDIRSVNGKVIAYKAIQNTGGAGQKNTAGQSINRSDNRANKSTSLISNDAFQGSPKWQWPASGKLLAPYQGESGLNKGIDLSGKLGEPVFAAASGRVVYAGSGLSGYGKLLIIKHNETFLSAYAHNAEILVKEGDLVKVGQRIADMGSSGTDRVKLHFEIRSDGSPVDPLKYLPKRQ
jgi:lipoprotein NlpD